MSCQVSFVGAWVGCVGPRCSTYGPDGASRSLAGCGAVLGGVRGVLSGVGFPGVLWGMQPRQLCVLLRFIHIFGGPADLPRCVQAWAVAPYLPSGSAAAVSDIGVGRIWGFCQPRSGSPGVGSSTCSCHRRAALFVASWDGASPPRGLPFSPPSHKGHLGQRED